MKGMPREVGVIARKHTITNSKSIRLLREAFSLSSYQKSVLIGMLLGDGNLNTGNWMKNYRLQIVQGYQQKEYLFWKFEIFRNCCFSEPSYQKWNNSWRIRTISHKEFNDYAQEFYHEKKKVIPLAIHQYLNPLALAIWFMDDGARGPYGSGYILNTQSFTYEENERLRSCLAKKFSLEWISIHKDKKWWRLYIRKKSEDQFRKIIEPFLIPSMKYKLHALDPVETTRRPPIDIGVKI